MPKAKRTKKPSTSSVDPYTSSASPVKRSSSVAVVQGQHPLGDGPDFNYTPPNKEFVASSKVEADSPVDVSDALGTESTGELFELPDVTQKSREEIVAMFGYDINPDGNVTVRKTAKGYNESEISLFNGKNLPIVFSDFGNNTLTMKTRLSKKEAQNLRKFQDAWVWFYYKHNAALAKADLKFAEAADWKENVEFAWEKYYKKQGVSPIPEMPSPENWRELHAHDAMKQQKINSDGTPYTVNKFFADKIVQKTGHDPLLKIDYPKGDKNCGTTIRKIVDNELQQVPIEQVNNRDTLVKGRFRIALGTHNGAPSWNVKCYNGGGRHFLVDDTGTRKYESREAREKRLANETPEERAAREKREAEKRAREDAADLEEARRLRAARAQ